MKYLVFREVGDDLGNELLQQLEVEKDFLSEEEVLVWLATLDTNWVGSRYLIVQPVSWVTAVMKEKPVTMYGHVDGFDPDTVARRQVAEDYRVSKGLPPGTLPDGWRG